ncbi:MAG: hypothetical protein H8E31_05265 [Planctomycetes bacterium]|nr:hypothetical protein [Planctomycetota bacterium]
MRRLLSTSLLLLPALMAGPAFAQEHASSTDLLKRAVELSLRSSELAAQGKDKEARALAEKAAALLKDYAGQQTVVIQRTDLFELSGKAAAEKAAAEADKAAHIAAVKAAKAAQAAGEAHPHAERDLLLHLRRGGAEQALEETEETLEVLREAFENQEGEVEREVRNLFAPDTQLRYRLELDPEGGDGKRYRAMLEAIDEDQLVELELLEELADVHIDLPEIDLQGLRFSGDAKVADFFVQSEGHRGHPLRGRLRVGDEIVDYELPADAFGEVEDLDLGEWQTADGDHEIHFRTADGDTFFFDRTGPGEGAHHAPQAGPGEWLVQGENLFLPELGTLFQGEDSLILRGGEGRQQIQIIITPEITVHGGGGRLELKTRVAPEAPHARHSKKVVIFPQGDSLEGTPERESGAADRWVEIALENPLPGVLDLSVGRELRLPAAPAGPMPPQPRDLSFTVPKAEAPHGVHVDEARALIDQMRAELEALRAELKALRSSVKQDERFR